MKKYLLFVFIISNAKVFSQWSQDTLSRNPVCTALKNQYAPRSCSDGAGGAIFAWVDERNIASEPSVFAQKINLNGKSVWKANGITVYDPNTNGTTGADYAVLVSDGAGGAIIVYESGIVGGARQLYAQHVSKSGTLLWGNGVLLSNVADSRLRWAEDPEQDGIASDGAGGAFITWQAYSAPYFIYAQHINASGNILWGNAGVGLSLLGSYNGYRSTIANSGNGTAVVGFTNSAGNQYYLQKISAAGSYLWGSSGLLVSGINTLNSSGAANIITYDSLNACIFTAYLTQATSVSPVNVTVQKIDLNGNILWKPGGNTITNLSGNNFCSSPDIIPDYKGGLFTVYDSLSTVKVQHVNSKGNRTWVANGITVDNTPGSYTNLPVLVSDGGTGIIVAYAISKAGYPNAIFSQRYTATGIAVWRANGIPVITNNADINHNAIQTTRSSKGYVITCWADNRIIGDENIYAARYGGSTGLSKPLPASSVVNSINILTAANSGYINVYPNPAKNFIMIDLPKTLSATVIIYDINGKQVMKENINSANQKINIASLIPGVYTIKITNDDSSQTGKFLKQ